MSFEIVITMMCGFALIGLMPLLYSLRIDAVPSVAEYHALKVMLIVGGQCERESVAVKDSPIRDIVNRGWVSEEFVGDVVVYTVTERGRKAWER